MILLLTIIFSIILITISTPLSVAWNTFYAVLRRKGTSYQLDGLAAMQQSYPMPSAYENLLIESLEPFFNKIKF